ncbi:hypothetical protein [Streptacidiphilus neutrinimicus]|uniref:hypothetical protein n=1 Tax=Streptacidiphilus neutrinimicus TaxID=105420 RepID=UPI0005AA8897|nr:hypothetical protein [Streptacidiphilus neutrinimicus]
MSYDLAVWEGERPTDDKAAARIFRDLYEHYLDAEEERPPTARIEAYVLALLERWGHPSEDETSPWAAWPLIRGASGPLVYFPMRWSMSDEASTFAAALAESMGLICFDPQHNGLRL